MFSRNPRFLALASSSGGGSLFSDTGKNSSSPTPFCCIGILEIPIQELINDNNLINNIPPFFLKCCQNQVFYLKLSNFVLDSGYQNNSRYQ